ncbi:hypothetical protein EFK68_03475 [Pseudomonas aeruginosa]|nr:hypothetical protein EFK68_03475 [Pseudomonas aeruginosa]
MKLICAALLSLITMVSQAADKTLNVTVVSTVDGVEVAKSVMPVQDDTPILFTDNVFVQHAADPVLSCRAGSNDCSGPVALTGPLRMGLTAVITARHGDKGKVLVEVDGRYALKDSGNGGAVIRMNNYQITGARAVSLGEKLDVEHSAGGHVVNVTVKVE